MCTKPSHSPFLKAKKTEITRTETANWENKHAVLQESHNKMKEDNERLSEAHQEIQDVHTVLQAAHMELITSHADISKAFVDKQAEHAELTTAHTELQTEYENYKGETQELRKESEGVIAALQKLEVAHKVSLTLICILIRASDMFRLGLARRAHGADGAPRHPQRYSHPGRGYLPRR